MTSGGSFGFCELTARIADSSSKNAVSFPIRVTNHTFHCLSLTGGYKPPFPIPETQSVLPLRAQRNAFRRRDAHQQSRSLSRWNQSRRPSNYTLHQMALIPCYEYAVNKSARWQRPAHRAALCVSTYQPRHPRRPSPQKISQYKQLQRKRHVPAITK
jgi:hypothetical protein